jgi:hypothetical protein
VYKISLNLTQKLLDIYLGLPKNSALLVSSLNYTIFADLLCSYILELPRETDMVLEHKILELAA